MEKGGKEQFFEGSNSVNAEKITEYHNRSSHSKYWRMKESLLRIWYSQRKKPFIWHLRKVAAWDLLIRSIRKPHKCLSNPKWLSDWCFLVAHTSGYTGSFQTRTKKKVISQMPDTNKCGTTCESYTVTTAALLWLSCTVSFKHHGKTPVII